MKTHELFRKVSSKKFLLENKAQEKQFLLIFFTEAKPSPFSNLANAMSSAGFAGSGPNGGIKPPLSRFSFGPPKPKAKESSVEISKCAFSLKHA